MPIRVSPLNGYQLLIKLGDGGSPESFAHPCTINTTRGITFSASPIETQLPYCDAPTTPSWVEREIDGKSASIAGAGVLDTDSFDVFWLWFDAGTSKNIQVMVNVDAAAGGGYWSGRALLTEFQLTGERRAKVEFSCTILSDGEFNWTPVAT